jgi:hypothetical protein
MQPSNQSINNHRLLRQLAIQERMLRNRNQLDKPQDSQIPSQNVL